MFEAGNVSQYRPGHNVGYGVRTGDFQHYSASAKVVSVNAGIKEVGGDLGLSRISGKIFQISGNPKKAYEITVSMIGDRSKLIQGGSGHTLSESIQDYNKLIRTVVDARIDTYA